MACLAAVALAGAASAALPSVALAADEEEEESIETKFIKGLFGISDRDSINYRERPPLVVPPNLGRLPQPEANAVVNTPSWYLTTPPPSVPIHRAPAESSNRQVNRLVVNPPV